MSAHFSRFLDHLIIQQSMLRASCCSFASIRQWTVTDNHPSTHTRKILVLRCSLFLSKSILPRFDCRFSRILTNSREGLCFSPGFCCPIALLWRPDLDPPGDKTQVPPV